MEAGAKSVGAVLAAATCAQAFPGWAAFLVAMGVIRGMVGR